MKILTDSGLVTLWSKIKTLVTSKAVVPDNEDLSKTSNSDGSSTLKLADRAYSASNFSGKGYKILRKNISNGKNILTQSMINSENTIYEIRYDFNLDNKEITIKDGCILYFKGGCLSDGKLSGEVKIQATSTQIFKDIDLSGLRSDSYDISWFGYTYGEDFGSFYTRQESLLPTSSTLFYKDKIFVDSPIYITKTINLELNDIECRNFSSDVFILGTSTKSANELNIKFNYLYSNNENYLKATNSGLKFINASFCNIDFNHISKIGYPINIVANNSCGQNIFNWNIIEEGNIGIKYNKAASWSDAQWTEGILYKFGFIRKFNIGINFEDNVRCNASIISGAIDCVEVEDSYDIVDNSNTTNYYTGNLYLLNYVRHVKWQNKKERDTIIEPSYGISSAGNFSSSNNIMSKHVLLGEGGVFIKDPVNKLPRVDFHNTQDVNVARINADEDGNIYVRPDSKEVFIFDNIRVKTIKNQSGEALINMEDGNFSVIGIPTFNQIKCTGNIDTAYLKAISGGVKVYDEIAETPRVDFFIDNSDSYVGRVSVNNGILTLYSKNNYVQIIGGDKVTVPKGTNSLDIKFKEAKPNTNYNVLLSPYSNANCWIISTTTQGFTLGISPSTENQVVGYTIIGY